MEATIRKHKLQSLKAQWVLTHDVCSSLTQEFEAESLADEQKTAIGLRLDAALRESQSLRLAIDLLERGEREEQVYY